MDAVNGCAGKNPHAMGDLSPATPRSAAAKRFPKPNCVAQAARWIKLKTHKAKIRMTREGIDFEAMLTPWLRLCIGVAVLFVAATPLVYAIAALVRASHQ